MGGLANDYLIYPILDLIRAEIRKSDTTSGGVVDPFEGTPSVALFRQHPLDEERITGAMMEYESGYKLDVQLTLGTDDVTTIPVGLDSSSPDWEYYVMWRLTRVAILALTPYNTPIRTHIISLNYDGAGRLTGTSVSRI